MTDALTVFTLDRMPEITTGDDLPAMIVEFGRGHLHTGDILAVTSKIVSKAEGRVMEADDREDAITAETVRVVATRMPTVEGGLITRIVENRLGLVMAAAGVDASNTAEGTVLLLPVDPDASARGIRTALRDALGIDIGGLITDTSGRAWRGGVRQRLLLRPDPRRPSRRHRARWTRGRRSRSTRQLDGPRPEDTRHGWRHGSGHWRTQSDRCHDASIAHGFEDRSTLQSAYHIDSTRRPGRHRTCGDPAL